MNSGHTPLSSEEDIAWTCRTLVVGTGAHGSLPVMDEVRQEAKRRKVGGRTYKMARALLNSPRTRRICAAGGRPQRLLWASTGTKDPGASDVVYVQGLASPFTINTMPEATLKAISCRSEPVAILPEDGGDCERVLDEFASEGIDVDALAAELQRQGAQDFVESWNALMAVIEAKGTSLSAEFQVKEDSSGARE